MGAVGPRSQATRCPAAARLPVHLSCRAAVLPCILDEPAEESTRNRGIPAPEAPAQTVSVVVLRAAAHTATADTQYS